MVAILPPTLVSGIIGPLQDAFNERRKSRVAPSLVCACDVSWSGLLDPLVFYPARWLKLTGEVDVLHALPDRLSLRSLNSEAAFLFRRRSPALKRWRSSCSSVNAMGTSVWCCWGRNSIGATSRVGGCSDCCVLVVVILPAQVGMINCSGC